jgi:hypothetical protein
MQRRILGQLTRTKVIYGFLILAFGMMLTDVVRLASAPAEVLATHGIRQGKF